MASFTQIPITAVPFNSFFKMSWPPKAALKSGLQSSYAPGTREVAPEGPQFRMPCRANPEKETGLLLLIPDDAEVVGRPSPDKLTNVSLGGVQLLGTNLLHNPRITPEQLAALQGVLFPDAFFAGDPESRGGGFCGRLPPAIWGKIRIIWRPKAMWSFASWGIWRPPAVP